MRKEPIPWTFSDDDFIQTWAWETVHFDAQIKSDASKFIYLLVDKTAKGKRPILDGIAHSFEEAENSLLETIGKSYPLAMGYRKYAGEQATTFRIYTGELIDFGPMEGRVLSLEVKDKDSRNRTLSGMLQVDHHSIMISAASGSRTKIPPAYIVKVNYDTNADSKRAGSGRTVFGKTGSSCTGIGGFRPGTVEHSVRAPFCPIHQV